MIFTHSEMNNMSVEEMKKVVFSIDTDVLEKYLAALKGYIKKNQNPSKQKIIMKELEMRKFDADDDWTKGFRKEWTKVTEEIRKSESKTKTKNGN